MLIIGKSCVKTIMNRPLGIFCNEEELYDPKEYVYVSGLHFLKQILTYTLFSRETNVFKIS